MHTKENIEVLPAKMPINDRLQNQNTCGDITWMGYYKYNPTPLVINGKAREGLFGIECWCISLNPN